MNRERWLSIKPSLETALDLDPEARRVWLAELAATSPDIAQQVEELLATESTERSDLLDEGLMIELPEPGASWVGRSLGPYRLERQIGRGGMGSVWLAHRDDGQVAEPVAFKLLNRALLGRAGRERFAREGRALARLSHPNIARMIDAGVTADGQPFLVLEYIVGRSIDEFADAARYTPTQRIALFLDVLDAVAHAHANLLVHRDIKPSNILVGEDGCPKLLDFGIAKLLSEGRDLAEPSSLSKESGHALTPRYAAPEQIRLEPVSAATDVYSLGVLLYVLLSGRHPTSEGCLTPADEIRAVVETQPSRLSESVTDARDGPRETAEQIAAARGATPEQLRRWYRGDLDTILAKTLMKAPAERYRTVTDLSADLLRFLNRDAVSGSWTRRASEFLRRHLPSSRP